MKLEVQDNTIFIKEVFNSVVFVTPNHERLAICMRDGGYEIKVFNPGMEHDIGKWLCINRGIIKMEEEFEQIQEKKPKKIFGVNLM